MTLTINTVGDNPQQPGIAAEAYLPDQLIAGRFPLVTDSITLTGAAALQRGSLLGRVTIGAATAAAKSGGNTGDGTCTMDATTPILVNAQVGAYAVRCISRVASAVAANGTSAAVAGNTGNGTVTASPATGSGCKVGTYTLVCEASATDAGIFVLYDPDSIAVAVIDVGVENTTHLTFTIADGSTDFVGGDAFTITVAASEYDETFRVTDPTGAVLGDVTVAGASGTATWSDQVKFELADGATDFVVGDGFDVTVAAGSGAYKLSLAAAVDGSAEPVAVLVDYSDPSSGDVVAGVYISGEFNSSAMTFGTGHTAASTKNGLAARSIFLKSVVSAADPS